MSDAVRDPQHLTSEHDVSEFDWGVPELDLWPKRRALQNESSRNYVMAVHWMDRMMRDVAVTQSAAKPRRL
jgi:hypothetical protein